MGATFKTGSRGKSDLIPWEDAKLMIEKYHCHGQRLTLPDGSTTLKGFRIDKEDLKALLDHSDEVTHVMVMFSISYDDRNNSSPDDQNLSVVFAAIENATATAGSGTIVQEPIMDKCEPCPPHCANYDALIQNPCP